MKKIIYSTLFLSLPFMALTQSLDDKICKDTNVPKK